MNRIVLCVEFFTMLVFVAIPSVSLGHHSASEYDGSRVVEIEGDVVKVFWRNPHVVLHVASENAGTKTVWVLEGASVSQLSRRGLTAEMISIGDHVRAAGAVSKRRPGYMLAEHVLTPGGKELELRGIQPPRWPDARLVGVKTGIEPAAAAAAKAMGLFRVWSWGRFTPGWWFFGPPANFSLTDAALAKFAKWNEFTDNPQLRCIAPGMPATMANPYPIEFVRAGNDIELHEEEFDVVRTIHMGQSVTDDVPASALGYSVGHWENDHTLVVSTTRINWPYFNRVGVSQSEKVKVVERFDVDESTDRLNYKLTVIDPETLTEPYSFESGWVWQPGEVVGKYACAVED